jgi:hypothetical protein
MRDIALRGAPDQEIMADRLAGCATQTVQDQESCSGGASRRLYP